MMADADHAVIDVKAIVVSPIFPLRLGRQFLCRIEEGIQAVHLEIFGRDVLHQAESGPGGIIDRGSAMRKLWMPDDCLPFFYRHGLRGQPCLSTPSGDGVLISHP